MTPTFNQEHPEGNVRRRQFYNLFLSPDVRMHVVEYEALAILDWEVVIPQKESFERLYSIAFEVTEPFWIKGSRHPGDYSEERATTGTWHPLDHLDGNAIYNNTDTDFFHFINFTLKRLQPTRP